MGKKMVWVNILDATSTSHPFPKVTRVTILLAVPEVWGLLRPSGSLKSLRERAGMVIHGQCSWPYKGQKALDPVHSADLADLQGKGTSLQGGTVPKHCGQERLGTEQLSSMVFVYHLPICNDLNDTTLWPAWLLRAAISRQRKTMTHWGGHRSQR